MYNNGSINSEEKYKLLINTAYDILNEVTPDSVNLKRYFESPCITTLSDVMDVMFSTLQDYQRMPNTIKYLENKAIFKTILENFNPVRIVNKYKSYGNLFLEFQKRFNFMGNVNDKFNLWVKYSKSVISACIFINHFSTLEDFKRFIEKYRTDELSIHALILLLQDEIYGMGIALACNFLKDIGYTDLGKPDVHLRDVYYGLGLCDESDFSILKEIQNTAEINNMTAFEVDRLIWLVCSGNYFYDGLKLKSKKSELINKLKSINFWNI